MFYDGKYKYVDMKNLIYKSTIALVVAVLLSSCAAFHSGYMSPSASLSSANFSYVKQNIQGNATATYILGIGGIAREALVDEAKRKMIASTPLRSNQALVNLTVNFKSSFYLGLLVRTVDCRVTADVVEFE